MKKIILFISAFILICPVFFGLERSKEIDGSEILLQSDGLPIRLSFEHYKMQDGWTPVVLSIGEIDCLLWMDASGKVFELRGPDADLFEPVCFIDVSTKILREKDQFLHFDAYEQNNIRTRWRLSSDSMKGTMAAKMLFSKKSGIELDLGIVRLQLKYATCDFKEFSPGLYQIQFHGPSIKRHQLLVYEKASGMIYSTHEWQHRLTFKSNQAEKIGRLATGNISPVERAALIALYNSTDGDNWTNNSGWKTPPLAPDGFALPGTENTWYGIGCDAGNTTVQSIYLFHNNLNGVLPQELGNLTNLRFLFLSENQLSGIIPYQLGSLVNLQELSLSWNQLSGSIPPELGSLSNLQILNLGFNELSGNIPPQLGLLANLQELWLQSNQLFSKIPSQLGNLANLQYLGLFSNWFGGNIPPEFGNLVNLQVLWLDDNNLSDNIPPELGNLANLQYLGLFSNQLSGYIPSQLGQLTNLRFLGLWYNQLSGIIPTELGELANLQILDLHRNDLRGTIPPQLGKLTNLIVLDLGGNQLTGGIPLELGNLTILGELGLDLNILSGSIPSIMGNLTKLQYLWLSGNQFSGSIPPELGNLVNLRSLYLSENQLSGNIPPELGDLVNLRYFFLNSNQLCGKIPSNLINLTNLYDSDSDLRWNALYSNDNALRNFLDSKQEGGNWESTQTIAPTNIAATAVSTTSIEINWTPIIYTSDSGGYRVFYSITPGGPYIYFGMTADKLASSLTVTGLNPGTTYYFVVQTRTYPHQYNQNTVDSEYSSEVSAMVPPLILTSPNGGESWGLHTIRNITWTFIGLIGNIRLELWKANKKLGDIASNIPIVNGNYGWYVGNFGQGIASTGNDYKVKIITANGLYSDMSNATFSIIQPSLILTSPRSNTSWQQGTQQNIAWTSVGLTGNVKLLLFKDGRQVGVIARGIPIANGTYTWTVGKSSNGLAPKGSNYTVKIRCEDNNFYSSGSGPFTIW